MVPAMQTRQRFSLQVGLNPARRMVNVDRLQSTRPEIDKTMRYACGSQNCLSGFGLDDLISDKKAGSTGDNDEGFIIGVNVKARTFTRRVVAIGQNGNR